MAVITPQEAKAALSPPAGATDTLKQTESHLTELNNLFSTGERIIDKVMQLADKRDKFRQQTATVSSVPVTQQPTQPPTPQPQPHAALPPVTQPSAKVTGAFVPDQQRVKAVIKSLLETQGKSLPQELKDKKLDDLLGDNLKQLSVSIMGMPVSADMLIDSLAAEITKVLPQLGTVELKEVKP